MGRTAANPYDHGSGASPGIAPPSSKGERQETRCRDAPFALLLIVNVVAIAAVAGIYGLDAISAAFDDLTTPGNATDASDGSNAAADAANEGAGGGNDLADAADLTGNGAAPASYQYDGYVKATFILGAIAIVMSGATLPVMICIPGILIKASLLAMLVLAALMVAVSFVTQNVVGGVVGLIFFGCFACYARAVWSRIPFATANLVAACTAIRAHAGVLLVALLFVALAFGWTLLWSVAAMGVWEEVYDEDLAADGQNPTNYGYLFLLLLSYFFTHQVVQNTVHVTVAGTVGSWWFSPGEGGCCGSLVRALTTSFGSICFGSLLVAIVQALRALAQQLRQQEGGIFICIAECILGCLESILEYFNKWAFVYVGLYGYSYIEAGKNVFALFKDRGWSAIIADDLISNVFFFLSLCVGLVCSGLGYLAFDADSPEGWFEDSPSPDYTGPICAGLGFLAGLVLSSILMSTIGSAVNTVIVCFAEGPAEFEANHPELSSQMREAWLNMYPDSGV